jgi:hypothetical protein
MIADRPHSKDAAGHRDKENYDNDFLHRTQTNRARHLTKRNQIQPVIFCRLHFSRFEKGKREPSLSDPANDLLGPSEQFNVPQRIKSAIKIREASCFTIIAPILFIKHQRLQLLVFWNVEGSLERLRV